MRKQFFVLCSFVVLSACSSSQKQELVEGAPLTTDTSSKVESMRSEHGSSDSRDSIVAGALNGKSSLAESVRSGNDEAIFRSATQVLAQNPADHKALFALGMYHFKKGQMLAAQYFFFKALKENPSSSELHNNIGLTYLGLKEKREAVKSFKKAIELNPNDAIAAGNLGSLYLEDRDFTKAAIVLEMALKKNSKDVKLLNNYAVALANKGKYDQAQSLYKDALKLSPNGKEVLFNYAILLIENLKQNQEGIEMINKLKFLGPTENMRAKIHVLETKAQLK
ncbi:MAG: hypothetical protein BroJett040_17670 [Oligoflexia bacterium]|nr:MAG: hypothetical protein BroJett040_17670 [Oligoflexia bacterium]